MFGLTIPPAGWPFFIGGLIAAAGPILIHLLNRRRYRIVPWAAMDFLREAVLRSRRVLQLRDLLLLALRTLCIVLFGLALAQPYLSGTAGAENPNDPIHAVLLVDNSLSMGYERLGKPLLDAAKEKGREFIDALPRKSRISVLPTCGPAGHFSYDAYYTKQEALDALAAVQLVDRATRPHETIDLALEACRRLPNISTKRLLLLTDRQFDAWPAESLREHFRQLPGPLEVVQVPDKDAEKGWVPENAWVSDFKVRDGMADVQTPAKFLATISYQGSAPRGNVQVTLTIDGQTAAVDTVNLEPGQKREVEFPPYQFTPPGGAKKNGAAAAPAEAGLSARQAEVTYATAEVSISHDALPADDRRVLVVPIVAKLPVLFVDQFGADENPRRNRYGATYPLRRLLAPTSVQGTRDRQLFAIDHKRIEEVDRAVLEHARLVVIAGVEAPGSEQLVALLREYVEQGGNLIIAAGGNFSPGMWQDAAWQEGKGILPAPLERDPQGKAPDELRPGDLPTTFKLEFNSLKDQDYFALETATAEELRDLYALPDFFKAVEASVNDTIKDDVVRAMAAEIQERRRNLKEVGARLADLEKREARGTLSNADKEEQADLLQQQGRLQPAWLRWASPEQFPPDTRPEQQVAEEMKPAVLARYTNGLPFLVERRQGHGRVLLVTSSLYPDWNTLALMNTVLVYDRIVRSLLQQTLPERNVGTQRRVVLPVPAADRETRFTLIGPFPQKEPEQQDSGKDPQQKDSQQKEPPTEPLAVEALGPDHYGVVVSERAARGIYRVVSAGSKNGSRQADAPPIDIPLAVNGPAEESELLASREAELGEGDGPTDALQAAELASLGIVEAQLHRTELWKWLVVAVLACLLLELVVLAWPALGGERTR